MNIRHKMTVFPVIVVLAILSIGLIAYQGFAGLDRAITEIYRNLKSSQDISLAEKNLTIIHADANKIVNWAAADYPVDKINDLARNIRAKVKETSGFVREKAESSDDQAEKESYRKILVYLNKYQEWIEKTIDMATVDSAAASMFLGSVDEQFSIAIAEMQAWDKEMGRKSDNSYRASEDNYRKTIKGFLTIVLIAIVTSVALTMLIAVGIIRPVRRVAEGLAGSAGQVASATGYLASSSSQLAEGASEQAAAIEETSSSLEEMASMTRQNAASSGQANTCVNDTSRVVEKARELMSTLTASMEEISKASEETSKIVKTIDDVAFQTNLLALNAAVEAARAGEAGAGFAVVADEVRNLAMRAAEAAKNTAEMIEDNVKRIQEGSAIVARTEDAFEKVSMEAKRVHELIGEIASANAEQAQGIEQLSKAVAEMDKVVQQNVAGAEETASASNQMNTQVRQLWGYVDALMTLIDRKPLKKATQSKRNTADLLPAVVVAMK